MTKRFGPAGAGSKPPATGASSPAESEPRALLERFAVFGMALGNGSGSGDADANLFGGRCFGGRLGEHVGLPAVSLPAGVGVAVGSPARALRVSLARAQPASPARAQAASPARAQHASLAGASVAAGPGAAWA